MNEQIDSELVDYLAATSGLSKSICQRLVLDVLAQFDEPLEAWVVRRHAELKRNGALKNEQIYAQIQSELPTRRFSAKPLTTRQVRRLIYG